MTTVNAKNSSTESSLTSSADARVDLGARRQGRNNNNVGEQIKETFVEMRAQNAQRDAEKAQTVSDVIAGVTAVATIALAFVPGGSAAVSGVQAAGKMASAGKGAAEVAKQAAKVAQVTTAVKAAGAVGQTVATSYANARLKQGGGESGARQYVSGANALINTGYQTYQSIKDEKNS